MSQPLFKQLQGFRGYVAEVDNASPEYLSSPSVNCLIDDQGVAETRLGYEDTTYNLNNATFGHTTHYMSKYDITFFAGGTKLFYLDWNLATPTVVDTGVTLTTGKTTRFAEFGGDLYLTNTTDGLRRLVVFRLRGAATISATRLNIDHDGAARLKVFSITSGNLRIQGTNEAFAGGTGSVTGAANNGSGLVRITTGAAHGLSTDDYVTIASVGGTTEANGNRKITVVTSTTFDLVGTTYANAYTSGGTWTFESIQSGAVLTTALTQGYADNAVALYVHDISGVSGIEKASKLFFWKRRLGMFGSEIANNADQPNSTIYYGKFSAPTSLEDIIVFPYNAGGSVTEMVGVSGRVTNAVPVKDFLYEFTDDEAYVTAAGDIILSGTGIGITTPELRDEEHGCLNEDCAVSMGNNEITYVTSDKRIMKIKLADSNGAAIVFPDDEFDRPMRKLLAFMDSDQTGAIAYRHKSKRRTYYQLKISSQWVTLCFDRNIKAWQPPQTGKSFKSVFERKGILYATSMTEDTIYRLDATYNDATIPIECYIATGILNVDDTIIDQVLVKGKITQSTTIGVKIPVNGAASEGVTAHTIVGTGFSYGTGLTLGSTTIGSTILSSDQESSEDFARFKRLFDIYPSEANRTQFVSYSFGDSHHYGISSIQLMGRSLPITKSR